MEIIVSEQQRREQAFGPEMGQIRTVRMYTRDLLLKSVVYVKFVSQIVVAAVLLSLFVARHSSHHVK